MTGWVLTAAFNLVVACAYVLIAATILRGLVRTRQLTANRLALATAAIFVTCALHHADHGVHVLGFGSGSPADLAAVRSSFGQWHDVLIDALTAVVGVVYLGLRRSYGMLLRSPAMFDHADEGRYRQLAANLPQTSIFQFDTDLRFILAEGERLAGTVNDSATLEGTLLSDLLPAELFEFLAPRYRAALAGEASDFDYADLQGRTFLVRARPMRKDGEAINAVLVVSEDVTAERRVQRELAAAQAFGAAVLNASPDVTTITDISSGAVTWSSRSVPEMLGWSDHRSGAQPTKLMEATSLTKPAEFSTTLQRVSVVEPPIHDSLVASEDQERVRTADAAVRELADGDAVEVRYRLRNAAGDCRWISRRMTPFQRDATGVVHQGLSVVHDVTDLVAAQERMQHAALHDPLTGLPNRTLLLDRLAVAIARADRDRSEFVVLFCDLDGFKRINDTDGHAAGDAVLVEVADRLRGVLRRTDTIARVGGDEFVMLLEPGRGTSATAAQRGERHGDDALDGDGVVAEPVPPELLALSAPQIAGVLVARIQQALTRPIGHGLQEYVVSASVGMAVARRGSVAEDVLRDADAAMYTAKQRGKNRVAVFDDSLRSELLDRSRIEIALRAALTPGGAADPCLSVAYQPVLDLSTGRLVSFEALARLTDSDGRAIPPDKFIPVAEDTGIIARLGDAVLAAALTGLVRWRAGHASAVPVTMAVNFSARQAQQADLPKIIDAALALRGLHPADLTMELTESVLLEAGPSTLRQLTELHVAGVGIAIDDFGTGYASLRYLTTLPVTSVKVDRSFTAGLPADPTSAIVVRAIAALAADLGLSCIVEGIETAEQLHALPSGTLGQGYLLGRPSADPRAGHLIRQIDRGAA